MKLRRFPTDEIIEVEDDGEGSPIDADVRRKIHSGWLFPVDESKPVVKKQVSKEQEKPAKENE